jgi:peptidoglycan/LPS O-acetylase OafA/YrhL
MTATAPVPPQPARLPLLDGLRGIAAVAVMLFHEVGMNGAPGAGRGFLAHSYLAVDFFLLLSGFVLARTFEPKFAAGLSARGFMAQRLRRLWPLMGLGVILGAAQFLLSGEPGDLPLLLGLGLMFVPHLAGTAEIFPLDGPEWSLLVELAINLAHATVLRRLPRWALLALAGVATLAVLRMGLRYGTLDLGWQQVGLWVGYARALFAYAVGVVMARNLPRLIQAGPAPEHGWIGPMALLPVLLWGPGLLPPALQLPACWLVMVAGFPVLMILSLRAGTPAAVAPALDWLGRLSFPLYAVHVPLLGLAALWDRAHAGHHGAMRLAGVALALAVAALLAETRLGGKPAPLRALQPAPA